MGKYYDGHYKDNTLSLNEVEKKLCEEKEKSEKLTEWPKDTE